MIEKVNWHLWRLQELVNGLLGLLVLVGKNCKPTFLGIDEVIMKHLQFCFCVGVLEFVEVLFVFHKFFHPV